MRFARRSLLLMAAAAFATVLLGPPSARALEPDKDGWYKTGEGIRKKTVVIVKVDVYSIAHYTRKLPSIKSKWAMSELDADKRFNWTMLRDVTKEQISKALEDAYALNGYKDVTRIKAFMSAFSGELKKGSAVSITYDSAKAKTTVVVAGGGTATVDGLAFMKGTWSIWFGNIDQPKLGDDLIKYLP
jgi:hypothetical protein